MKNFLPTSENECLYDSPNSAAWPWLLLEEESKREREWVRDSTPLSMLAAGGVLIMISESRSSENQQDKLDTKMMENKVIAIEQK